MYRQIGADRALGDVPGQKRRGAQSNRDLHTAGWGMYQDEDKECPIK